jgi:hypothetical protein
MTDSQRRATVRRIKTIASIARARDMQARHEHLPDLGVTAQPRELSLLLDPVRR